MTQRTNELRFPQLSNERKEHLYASGSRGLQDLLFLTHASLGVSQCYPVFITIASRGNECNL